jgi:hypothetical protein
MCVTGEVAGSILISGQTYCGVIAVKVDRIKRGGSERFFAFYKPQKEEGYGRG